MLSYGLYGRENPLAQQRIWWNEQRNNLIDYITSTVYTHTHIYTITPCHQYGEISYKENIKKRNERDLAIEVIRWQRYGELARICIFPNSLFLEEYHIFSELWFQEYWGISSILSLKLERVYCERLTCLVESEIDLCPML